MFRTKILALVVALTLIVGNYTVSFAIEAQENEALQSLNSDVEVEIVDSFKTKELKVNNASDLSLSNEIIVNENKPNIDLNLEDGSSVKQKKSRSANSGLSTLF